MLFSKNAFFFLLLFLLLAPVVLPNVIWLLRSAKTSGRVEGIGAASGISLGPDTYAYVSFQVGKDTFYFQGKDDHYQTGDVVPVRYQIADPQNARVAAFYSLWGNTIAYSGVPLIFWVICFFAPDIVPKGSSLRLGGRPFLKVIPPSKTRG